MTTRLLRILIALDIFLFALLTMGDARRNETISAACWSLEQDGKLLGRIFRPLIDALFFFDARHCESSFRDEQQNPIPTPEP